RYRTDRSDHGPYRQERLGTGVALAQSTQGDHGRVRGHRRKQQNGATLMFGLPLGIVVETLVAVLLATTIGYCVILNQRLKRLHADRGELRQMVADLVQATGLANTAIQELKATAQDAEAVLSNRLNEAERFGVELASHVNAGQQLIDRLARITSVARGQ